MIANKKDKQGVILPFITATILAMVGVLGANQISSAKQRPSNAVAPQVDGKIAQCRNADIAIGSYRKGSGWSTCNGYKLIFQNDGNLVIYNPSGQPLWATGTDGYANTLAFQSDGNIVLYQSDGKPIWATNTYSSGKIFSFQVDGNFVVYASNGRAVWASGTDGGQSRTRTAARDWGWRPDSPQVRNSKRKVDAFVNQFKGVTGITRYDIQGAGYNGQCVTLIARYLQEHYSASRARNSFYLDHGRGTARSVANQFPGSFLPVSDPADPIPGSIISFPTIGNGYGHVALVVSAQRSGSSLNLTILDSNGDGRAPNTQVTLRYITVNTNNYSASGYGSGIYWVNPRD